MGERGERRVSSVRFGDETSRRGPLVSLSAQELLKSSSLSPSQRGTHIDPFPIRPSHPSLAGQAKHIHRRNRRNRMLEPLLTPRMHDAESIVVKLDFEGAIRG